MGRLATAIVLLLLVGCSSSSGDSAASDPPQEPEGRVTFADPGVHGFVDPGEDERSTFGVDVDTAAYTVARRFVTDGSLPPADSVRVEEFVNFFDQGYAAPEEDAFAIEADGAPTPFLSDADNRLLRIGLQSRAAQPSQRRRAALTFVVDVSGSMAEGNRLGLVRESLQLLVEGLRGDDRVAIVAYGDTARVVLEPTPVRTRDRILAAIDTLQPEGSTNAEAGLTLGYRLARTTMRPGDINRVVLASDGVANVGVTRPRALLDKIADDAAAGIQLVTVGVGMGNYNDVLMEQLADKGDGFYAYIDSLAEAQRVFSDTITTTLEVVALDAKVQVEFTDAVQRYRLLGFENRDIADDRFTDDTVAAGAVGPGHTVTALYEVSVAPGTDGEDSLATVRVRWTDPGTSRPRQVSSVVPRSAIGSSFAQAAPTFRLDATAAAYAERLRDSPYAEKITLARVARVAQDVAEVMPEDPKVAEFAALTTTAAGLQP